MSVVVETTLGDITIDLFVKQRPRACINFLKLCKMKYYNYNLFHTIRRGFIAQTGDPTGSRNGGESIHGVLEGPLKRYFEAEKNPRIKHTTMGLVSFVGIGDKMIGSQFFLTLGTELTYLDDQHCVFGEVMEGMDVLELLNEAICDQDNRPYQDVRITHTVVLDDPFPDPETLKPPSRSPSPSAERLQGGRIAPDEDIDETQGRSIQEVVEIIADKEAKARATILEMIGDIPDAEMAPPENVLFICKLNPVTTDDDLEIIFSRFGKIKSCEIIRDKKTAESLQYAFVEFCERKSCEDAYFKMDNVLIDDRRIHVDFSQSVAKVKWHGKGRGVTTYDDAGKRNKDGRNDIGNGRYKAERDKKNESRDNKKRESPARNYDRYERHKKEHKSSRDGRSRSPRRSNDKDATRRDSYNESRGNAKRNDTEWYYSNKDRDSYRRKETTRHKDSDDRNYSRNYRSAANDSRRRSKDRDDRGERRKDYSRYKERYDASNKTKTKENEGERSVRKSVRKSCERSASEQSGEEGNKVEVKNTNNGDSDSSSDEKRKKKKQKRKDKSTAGTEDESRKSKKTKKKRRRKSSSSGDS